MSLCKRFAMAMYCMHINRSLSLSLKDLLCDYVGPLFNQSFALRALWLKEANTREKTRTHTTTRILTVQSSSVSALLHLIIANQMSQVH